MSLIERIVWLCCILSFAVLAIRVADSLVHPKWREGYVEADIVRSSEVADSHNYRPYFYRFELHRMKTDEEIVRDLRQLWSRIKKILQTIEKNPGPYQFLDFVDKTALALIAAFEDGNFEDNLIQITQDYHDWQQWANTVNAMEFDEETGNCLSSEKIINYFTPEMKLKVSALYVKILSQNDDLLLFLQITPTPDKILKHLVGQITTLQHKYGPNKYTECEEFLKLSGGHAKSVIKKKLETIQKNPGPLTGLYSGSSVLAVYENTDPSYHPWMQEFGLDIAFRGKAYRQGNQVVVMRFDDQDYCTSYLKLLGFVTVHDFISTNDDFEIIMPMTRLLKESIERAIAAIPNEPAEDGEDGQQDELHCDVSLALEDDTVLLRREDGAIYLDCSEDLLLLDVTNVYIEEHFYDYKPFDFSHIGQQYEEALSSYDPQHNQIYEGMPLIYQIPPPVNRIVFDGITIFWFVVATMVAGEVHYHAYPSYENLPSNGVLVKCFKHTFEVSQVFSISAAPSINVNQAYEQLGRWYRAIRLITVQKNPGPVIELEEEDEPPDI